MLPPSTQGKDSNEVLDTVKGDDGAQVHYAKRERRFLWKLDIILITWAWISYTIRLIDGNNYRTAYASGMKEDLNFQGNQLNYLDTLFRIGYALFLIPSQLILTRIRPSIWLPGLEMAWGVMTALMVVPKSAVGMYPLRFFIGVFEASSYPGIVTVLCSWYTPAELSSRLTWFLTSYPASNIFVSFMQAAIAKTLDGKNGWPGWKYLFMINALMTFVVAGAGFFFVPDSPGSSRAFWMTAEDNAIAKARMDRVKSLPPMRLTKVTLKRTFTTWPLYIFLLTYATHNWSQDANVWIILFLKAATNADGSKRFDVAEMNAIPIGGYVLQIIAAIGFAWITSRTGRKATFIIIQQVTLVIGTIILSVWPASFGLKMFGYFILWLSLAAGPIIIAWLTEVCPCSEQRALIIGITITLQFSVNAWQLILIYPASQAPHYRVGYKMATVYGVLCIIFTGVFRWFTVRQSQQGHTDSVSDLHSDKELGIEEKAARANDAPESSACLAYDSPAGTQRKIAADDAGVH